MRSTNTTNNMKHTRGRKIHEAGELVRVVGLGVQQGACYIKVGSVYVSLLCENITALEMS